MLELRVAVGVLGALLGLDVRLQAVAERAQQLRDRAEVDLVTEFAQAAGELAHALERPAQRPLGIAAAVLLDEPLQVLEQHRIGLCERLAACARAAHTARLEQLTRLQLANPLAHRLNRQPRRSRHRRDPAASVRARLRRSP